MKKILLFICIGVILFVVYAAYKGSVPSERALKVASHYYLVMTEQQQEEFRQKYDVSGSPSDAVKNFAVFLDANQEKLVLIESAIEKDKSRQNMNQYNVYPVPTKKSGITLWGKQVDDQQGDACQNRVNQYSSCMSEYNAELSEYNVCITEKLTNKYKYCYKPFNNCIKPYC